MEHRLYLYSAVAGCTILLVQVVLQVFGLFGEADMDGADGDAHADHGSSAFFGFLSFKAITAFIGIFGLAGLALESEDRGPGARLALAVGAGACGMVIVGLLMRGLSRLHASGTVQLANAVGRTADVYLRIPANGKGKVTLEIQGRTMELDAVGGGDEIPTGARVRVIEVLDGTTVKVESVQKGVEA